MTNSSGFSEQPFAEPAEPAEPRPLDSQVIFVHGENPTADRLTMMDVVMQRLFLTGDNAIFSFSEGHTQKISSRVEYSERYRAQLDPVSSSTRTDFISYEYAIIPTTEMEKRLASDTDGVFLEYVCQELNQISLANQYVGLANVKNKLPDDRKRIQGMQDRLRYLQQFAHRQLAAAKTFGRNIENEKFRSCIERLDAECQKYAPMIQELRQ